LPPTSLRSLTKKHGKTTKQMSGSGIVPGRQMRQLLQHPLHQPWLFDTCRVVEQKWFLIADLSTTDHHSLTRIGT
jgi:hypothetical protein